MKLIEWLLKLLNIFSSREKAKRQRVIEYIDNCLQHLKVIIFYEKYNESEIEYSRKFIQEAHKNLHVVLDKVASAIECNIIKNSLMSGRIYYHAVKYGSVDDEEIKANYVDRLYAYVNHMYDQNEFRQNSNEYVLKELVMNGKVIASEERGLKLSKIKMVCEEDIARIENLREILKTRQVFYISI